jgi:hypothetical protein
MPRPFAPTRRHPANGWVVRNPDRTATVACTCGTVTTYPRRRQAVHAARRHHHGALQPVPARHGRWLAVAFVLLAALAFAVVVEGLAGLASRAAPAPAAPTTATVAPGYVPVPAGPPPSEPATTASLGGGR